MYVYFPPITILSFAACVIGSYMTAPVDDETITTFYRSVRPFGVWGYIHDRTCLADGELSVASEGAGITLVNVVLGMVAVTGYYLFPMYLVGHWHKAGFLCLGAALASSVALIFTWYRNLPLDNEL